MKKLPIVLKTPARVVIALGLIVLLSEVLIMVLIESIHATLLKDDFLESVAWKFVDPIVLTAIVVPALYLLVFRPLNQQAELERQLDELRRFQQLTLGRELRMKELAEEIAALRHPLSAEPVGAIPVTSGSLEAPHHAAEQYGTSQPTEESQRSALLFMLEDLENTRRKVEQAHHEWIAALDVVNDPIFLHDKQFRILRCNKAYQQRAGFPFKQIIGQPYYEIFPKTGAPLAGCLRVMEKAEAAADEEEMVIGDTSYRSRTFSVYGEQRGYLHSVHILEDITESRRAEVAQYESEEKFRTLYESSRDAIMTATPDEGFLGGNSAAIAMFGCRDEQEFIALTPASVSPEFQPDGRKSADKAQEMMRLAMENGSHSFEWAHKRMDGSEFPADVLLTRTKIGGKSVIQATVRDITERKQAEQALYESEKLYHSLFENMLNGFAYCQMIFEQDHPQDFIYLSVNAAFETLTGLKNVVGKRVSEVIPGIRQSDARLFDMCGRVSLSGKAERFEIYLDALQQWFWISVYSPEKGYFVAVFDVITERKHAEAALRESEARIRSVFEQANDGIYIISAENRYLDANARGLELLGYTRDELLQMGVADVLAPHEVARLAVEPPQMMSGVPHLAEWEHVCKDDSTFPGEVSARRLDDHSYLAIVRDLTERRHNEAVMRESEAKFRAIIESSPVAMAMNDEQQNITFLNRKFIEMFGYTLADIPTLAEWWPRAYPDPAYRQHVAQLWQAAVEKAQRDRTELEPMEYKVTGKDGAVRDIRFSMASMGTSSLVIFYDLTERKRAEMALRESEERFGRALENIPDVVVIYDHDLKIQYVNDATRRITGRPTSDFIGRREEEIWPPEVYEAYLPTLQEAFKTRTIRSLETNLLLPNGASLVLQITCVPLIDENGEVREVLGITHDFTERKKAEVAIQHANRALATLGAVNRTLVHATDEDELLQAICQAIVEQRGYWLAWVGYVQYDESKSVKIMARAGHDEGYLDALHITWAETEHGMGPSGRAVRDSATQLCQDIASDPLYLPWREAARQRGYAASIALPLMDRNANKVFGILNVYAEETNAFTPNEIDLLEEMAGDLAFGVSALYTRHERDLALEQSRLHLEKLRNSLEDTVRAIATIVEMRDPYTAGHQVRVANLAAAIAKQMALPEEQIHAIHLAGVVHDLGKIQIPAEILSKPGRINDLEFGLIKVHPQAGYDILKGIDFPWPIAQMVWQHHERLDGSGYPQGLKGEDILLEARLLAVADVVEAMAAHRPYRPGLGIEVALAEITKQRGIHYDPRVVDACVALFREQHYSFTS